MTYPRLKPCPTCGGETEIYGYEGWNGGISSWRVECDDCNDIGSCEGRKLDAIREHNRRAAELVAARATGPASPQGTERSEVPGGHK